MASDFVISVGKLIHRLRRSKGMSLDQLAKACGKSKATIHNYENGKTAVDIETLLLLSQVLGVSAQQFFVLPESGPDLVEIIPFGKVNALYLYHLQEGRQFVSVIKPWAASGGADSGAVLFYKLADPGLLDSSACVYHGAVYNHYSILSFTMRNHFNHAEHILINFSFRGMRTNVLRGIISGIDSYTLVPIAFKVLLTPDRLEPEQVNALLKPSREDMKNLREKSVLKAQNL